MREAPYAFGSKLSEWQGPGDIEERWRERLSSVPLNIVASLDNKSAGMVSALTADDTTVELISMWVAPSARGYGVGEALIRAVETWARERGAKQIELAVRDTNSHAIALYSRHGFIDVGPNPHKDEPPERLMIKQVNPE